MRSRSSSPSPSIRRSRASLCGCRPRPGLPRRQCRRRRGQAGHAGGHSCSAETPSASVARPTGRPAGKPVERPESSSDPRDRSPRSPRPSNHSPSQSPRSPRSRATRGVGGREAAPPSPRVHRPGRDSAWALFCGRAGDGGAGPATGHAGVALFVLAGSTAMRPWSPALLLGATRGWRSNLSEAGGTASFRARCRQSRRVPTSPCAASPAHRLALSGLPASWEK